MHRPTLAALPFLLTTLAAQSPIWARAAVLEPRSGQSMVHDPGRHVLTMFGGFQTARYDETWEWDGVGWTLRTPAVRPAGRRDQAMAYDSARQRAVMFGGNAASGGIADTWEWDGNVWAQISPPLSPSPRDGAMLAFDAAQGVSVLYGGQGATALGDTWTWNGTAWTQLSPATTPGLRALGAMSYDSTRQKLVLFGGTNGAANQNDTWEWNGSTWTPAPTPTLPPARQRHGLAYDSALGRTVLFAGSAGAVRFNDVWQYDGSDWTPIPTPPTAPVVRDRIAFAYDADRARVLLFGGRGPTNAANLADTWDWDGASWTSHGATAQPAARAAHALALDTADHAVLLFGGLGAGGRLQDTWQWDGGAWTQRLPATLPPARSDHALAWDDGRKRAVLFGGLDAGASALADTWEWTGADWTAASPPTSPAARSGLALAYDSARGRTVLFGGLLSVAPVALADTWEWDGSQWLVQAPATSPPARSAHALAFDAARGRTVLFGGITAAPAAALADTWEWDGALWTASAPAISPAARSRHALAFDAARGRTVLFGGSDAGFALLGDTWEWDGSAWAQTATTGPSGRAGLAVAYDPVRRRQVLFGGALASATSQETWEYTPANGADVMPFGSGCAGTFGVPVLAATSAPFLGNSSFALRLSQLVPGAFDLLALGFERTAAAFGGCNVYATGAAAIVSNLADGGGASTFAIPVPAIPALLGARLFAQGAGVDAGGALFSQLSLSRAVDVRVGL